jgi:hypothetical protein
MPQQDRRRHSGTLLAALREDRNWRPAWPNIYGWSLPPVAAVSRAWVDLKWRDLRY